MQYIIRTDQPFRGHCQSVIINGKVAYTDGLTFVEYKARELAEDPASRFKLMKEADFFTLVDKHLATMVTSPVEITEERYDYALNVLPPCRWHGAGGKTFFHISERLTANLVSWYATLGDKYWEFTDRDNLTDKELTAKFA